MTRFRPSATTNPAITAQYEAALREMASETAKSNDNAMPVFDALFGRGRAGHTPGVMNPNETRFLALVLTPLKDAGVIDKVEFEPETVELPIGRYTCDFGARTTDGPVHFEVKEMVRRRRGGYKTLHVENRQKFILASERPGLWVWAKWHPGRGRYLMEGWRAGKRIKRWKGLE